MNSASAFNCSRLSAADESDKEKYQIKTTHDNTTQVAGEFLSLTLYLVQGTA